MRNGQRVCPDLRKRLHQRSVGRAELSGEPTWIADVPLGGPGLFTDQIRTGPSDVNGRRQRMYRHTGRALLRAARVPLQSAPTQWPDLASDIGVDGWVTWLRDVWSRKGTAEAIALASPSLARRVEQVLTGAPLKAKDIRRAVASVVRYVLRETARPTPFGLFAGVSWVGFGPTAEVRWGRCHRPAASVDGQWLFDVIAGLESCPELLDRLAVVVNNLRSVRSGRLVLPGTAQVSVRHTSAVRAVERAACRPVRVASLVDALADEFPTARSASIHGMLAELVAHGFLVTSLRPPATITDPLAYLLDQLQQVGADSLASVTATVRDLRMIRAELDHYEHARADERATARASAMRQMRDLSPAGRASLAVDLQLDCDLMLPEPVAYEAQAAASALLRLGTQPGGSRVWRDYYAAFVERYGIGALVAITDLVDPDIGLGYPAGYPGSLLDPPPEPARSMRDDRLLALVHQAAIHGPYEIIVDDDMIRDLAVGDLDAARIPPHIELCVRVHAESLTELDQGEFTLAVIPARGVGTMTGRFTPGTSVVGPADVFQHLPTSDADAIPAQLSFPPLYPHAENISRVQRFLPHIISLGEHRTPEEDGSIPLEDLVVTADRQRLRLVSVSQHRPVEPQVFHALRLDKQPPTLARFLAHLPRSHTAAYTEFSWGAAAGLPHLPRVRYRRSVLSPARWQLDAADLPGSRADWSAWRQALARWQRRWRLPEIVELRDADRTLRLELTESAHIALLRAHLNRSGQAVLTETVDSAGYGWLDGHAHQIAVPLVSAQPTPPSRLRTGPSLVHISNDCYGQLPGAAQSKWLFAKVYVQPDRQSEVLAEHLPQLLAELGDHRRWWFLRHRSAHEPDHLRLRVCVTDPGDYGTCAAALGEWAAWLRSLRISRQLVLDTYYPEVGRYGDGPVLAAAEAVFADDSTAVLTQLQRIRETVAHPTAVAVANIVDIACGFAGGTEPGMKLLTRYAKGDRPAPAPRAVADLAVELADPHHGFAALRQLAGGEPLAAKWVKRRTALARYRQQLHDQVDADAVLSSLLHMHHIRAVGIDRDHERVCRRLARAAALRWRARGRRR